MANSMDMNIEGTFLISNHSPQSKFHGNERTDDLASRVFFATGGFGAESFTNGTAVFGFWVEDGLADRHHGYDFNRFATDREIMAALGRVRQSIQEDSYTGKDNWLELITDKQAMNRSLLKTRLSILKQLTDEFRDYIAENLDERVKDHFFELIKKKYLAVKLESL